MYHVMRDS